MAINTPSLHLITFWGCASTLEGAAKDRLLAAAEVVWPYARMSAYSYLRDETRAVDVIEQAMSVLCPYLARTYPLPSSEKVAARLRSQVRRIIKQEARRRKEDYTGSVTDLEQLAPGRTVEQDLEQRILVQQVLRHLPPQARQIAEWIGMGYTWREIGENFDADHTTIRRAFLRDCNTALSKIPRDS